ncbi:MAG: short-chain dehydrogenase [Thalassospira sp.]|uniref:NnrS family protein n=1 Tax=Thalassospira sp. TaxID=1912094 RepID=UPI000C35C8C3|nr:NnrS family protein [Thalassospira sp.]MAL40874.1 short-chain dehydrogenase [Thalassospira sp.]
MATKIRIQEPQQGNTGFLSHGFRPFFLLSSIWAAAAMIIWVLLLMNVIALPLTLDIVSWHAHEFLFGYLGAVIAGFMLTAVPNWTGRLPIRNRRLGMLVLLWMAGRIVILLAAHFPAGIVVSIDLSFLIVFALMIAREVIAGKSKRNFIVLGLLGTVVLGNAVFHWEILQGEYAAQGVGLRLGLAASIMLVALIGGRIVPSFTRNWLAKQKVTSLPAQVGKFDMACLVMLFVAVMLWVVFPFEDFTALALALAGSLHFVRLSRWQGHQTGKEPLVWILHAGYAFVPLGAVALAVATLMPSLMDSASAQHLWMGGAIGVMTIAVMTRATLGHTGSDLVGGAGTTSLYACIILATLTRVTAGFLPTFSMSLYGISAALWVASFTGFALLYGPLLLKKRT